MTKLLIITAGILLSTLSLTAQYTLKIEIKELRNSKGNIALALLNGEEELINRAVSTISDKVCHISFENLEPGQYAFKYIHDENKNDELDTNIIGFPKEGFGFSNNASGSFGPPEFEDMIFTIEKDLTVSCQALYLSGK